MNKEFLMKPLECSLCMDYFKDARMFYCGHSFCFKCIEDLWKQNASKFFRFLKISEKFLEIIPSYPVQGKNFIDCPTCRKPILFNKNIPKNFVLQGLVDDYNNMGGKIFHLLLLGYGVTR